MPALESSFRTLVARSTSSLGSYNGQHVYIYTEASRIVYLTLSVIGILILCYLLWRRTRHLRLKDIASISYIRSLVYTSYILAICFICTAIGMNSDGIFTIGKCYTAVYFCIGFLFAGKGTMQLFLVERAHVANISYQQRRRDPIWLMAMSVLLTFGVFLLVWTYLHPVAYISNIDGHCSKGLPPRVVAPIQVFDFVLNSVLTGVFIVMLRRTRQLELFPQTPERECTIASTLKSLLHPHDKLHRTVGVSSNLSSAEIGLHGVDESVILPPSTRPSKLHDLARKSLIGTVLMLLWSTVNSTIFYVTKGHEHAWLCFVQCNLDVFFSVLVLHWLTTNAKDDEHRSKHVRPSVSHIPAFLTSARGSVTEATTELPPKGMSISESDTKGLTDSDTESIEPIEVTEMIEITEIRPAYLSEKYTTVRRDSGS